MPTTEKKPLTNAERAREYRARKRLEREAAAAVAAAERDARDAAAANKPFRYVESVEAALAAMKWIRDSDGAAVDLVKLAAVKLDRLVADEPDATSKFASLSQLIFRGLRELGGTPTMRLQHELRSMRAAAGLPAEDGEHDHEDDARRDAQAEAAGGAIISSIQRPPKRTRA